MYKDGTDTDGSRSWALVPRRNVSRANLSTPTITLPKLLTFTKARAERRSRLPGFLFYLHEGVSLRVWRCHTPAATPSRLSASFPGGCPTAPSMRSCFLRKRNENTRSQRQWEHGGIQRPLLQSCVSRPPARRRAPGKCALHKLSNHAKGARFCLDALMTD